MGDLQQMLENLGALTVLFRRDRTDLLDHRHVNVGFGVTSNARIAIPVPCSAEIAALLDNANIVVSGLAQLRNNHQPAYSAPGDGHFDLIMKPCAHNGLAL